MRRAHDSVAFMPMHDFEKLVLIFFFQLMGSMLFNLLNGNAPICSVYTSRHVQRRSDRHHFSASKMRHFMSMVMFLRSSESKDLVVNVERLTKRVSAAIVTKAHCVDLIKLYDTENVRFLDEARTLCTMFAIHVLCGKNDIIAFYDHGDQAIDMPIVEQMFYAMARSTIEIVCKIDVSPCLEYDDRMRVVSCKDWLSLVMTTIARRIQSSNHRHMYNAPLRDLAFTNSNVFRAFLYCYEGVKARRMDDMTPNDVFFNLFANPYSCDVDDPPYDTIDEWDVVVDGKLAFKLPTAEEVDAFVERSSVC